MLTDIYRPDRQTRLDITLIINIPEYVIALV